MAGSCERGVQPLGSDPTELVNNIVMINGWEVWTFLETMTKNMK